MSEFKELFSNNVDWADNVKEIDPEYFSRLAEQQSPEYLWIGCSDSRIAANEIVGMAPGSIFVHRNIANVVVHTDLNCLSVIQYAVEVLKVKHIMVVGHYGCGGIKASMESADHGLIDNWLEHIRDVYRNNASSLDAMPASDRENRLCELNVIQQVQNVSATTTIRNAWAAGQDLQIHGLVYGLGDGLLRNLNVTRSGQPLN